MKIELKNQKDIPTLSRDSNAYSADVWIDGKPFAHVSNDGNGGCDDQRPHKDSGLSIDEFETKLVEVNEHIATQHPHHLEFNVKYDLELWVGAQMDDFVQTKWAKGQLSRNILIVRDGNVYPLKFRRGVSKDAKIAAAVKTYGRENVLNCIPVEDAVRILVEA